MFWNYFSFRGPAYCIKEIAKEDVDEKSNGDLPKKVFPQVFDNGKDDEGEEDEEAGDKTCRWVENVAKLFSLSGMKTIEHFTFWTHELARKIIYLESAEVSQT